MVVSACGSNGPSFISMSAVELNAHNRERPLKNIFFALRSAILLHLFVNEFAEAMKIGWRIMKELQ